MHLDVNRCGLTSTKVQTEFVSFAKFVAAFVLHCQGSFEKIGCGVHDVILCVVLENVHVQQIPHIGREFGVEFLTKIQIRDPILVWGFFLLVCVCRQFNSFADDWVHLSPPRKTVGVLLVRVKMSAPRKSPQLVPVPLVRTGKRILGSTRVKFYINIAGCVRNELYSGVRYASTKEQGTVTSISMI